MSSLFDVVGFIERINIITIVFFLFTLTFVVYEWILFRKGRVQSGPPQIPTFDQNGKPLPLPVSNAMHATPLEMNKVYSHRTQLIVVGIIIILSLSATIAGFFINKKEPPVEKQFTQAANPPVVTPSKGVSVYSTSWKALSSGEIADLGSGDTIYVTIDTLNTKEFTKARIRVNDEVWLPEHETTLYDNTHHVYYQSYTIPQDTTQLKIDAQLHSKSYGWPLTN